MKKKFLAGQLAQFLNGPDKEWPSQYFLKFGWAKNGCDWPSQMGFSPTLVFKTQADPKTRKKSGSIVCLYRILQ